MTTQDYLKKRNVSFHVHDHEPAYDASHLAQTLHVQGRKFAKTVLLRADHGYSYLVAVLPATHRVDLSRVSQLLGGSDVRLACEEDVARHCPNCERGVLPPFGSHFDTTTIIDRSLCGCDEIVFEGDTHTRAIRMQFRDYYNLEHPLIADIAGEG